MGIFSRFSKPPYTSAIILCAGASSRFGTNKQMALVCDAPVIQYTINAFEQSDIIKEIVLVVPKDDIKSYQEIIIMNDFKKVSAIVTGGETRQISALRGLKHISEKASYVAVHDGARCLVTTDIIEAVFAEALEHKCATAATKMTDTVKLADKDGFISQTVDRSFLWTVQTPQIFDAEIYKAVTYVAMQNEVEATDDCMLAESAGIKVKLVETGKDNIKITHPCDIAIAEHIIEKRKEDFR